MSDSDEHTLPSYAVHQNIDTDKEFSEEKDYSSSSSEYDYLDVGETSIVHNKLKDKLVDRQDVRSVLISYYKETYKTICPLPWVEGIERYNLDDVSFNLHVEKQPTVKSLRTVWDERSETEAISINEILVCDEKEKHTRILIHGEPGSGKSTLANKLAWDWAKGTKTIKHLEDFQLVFVVRMCFLSRTDSLFDYLHEEYFPDISNEEWQGCKRIICNSKVLLIFEGYDELQIKTNIMEQTLQKAQLHDCTMILTSRYGATNVLVQSVNFDIRYSLKRLGFKDVHKFIVAYADNETQTMFLKLFAGHYPVIDILSTPLYLWFYVLLGKEHFCDTNFTTRTDFFTQMIKGILDKIKTLSHLDVESLLVTLQDVAFKCMQRETLQIPGDIDSIKDLTCDLGFLTKMVSRRGIKPNTVYMFTHKTILEYLCAKHIVDTSMHKEKILTMIQNLPEISDHHKRTASLLLPFVVGLISDKQDAGYPHPQDILREFSLYQLNEDHADHATLQCIAECKEGLKFDSEFLSISLGNEVKLRKRCSPYCIQGLAIVRDNYNQTGFVSFPGSRRGILRDVQALSRLPLVDISSNRSTRQSPFEDHKVALEIMGFRNYPYFHGTFQNNVVLEDYFQYRSVTQLILHETPEYKATLKALPSYCVDAVTSVYLMSTLWHEPAMSTLWHEPAMSTLWHEPAMSTLWHEPAMSTLWHEPMQYAVSELVEKCKHLKHINLYGSSCLIDDYMWHTLASKFPKLKIIEFVSVRENRSLTCLTEHETKTLSWKAVYLHELDARQMLKPKDIFDSFYFKLYSIQAISRSTGELMSTNVEKCIGWLDLGEMIGSPIHNSEEGQKKKQEALREIERLKSEGYRMAEDVIRDKRWDSEEYIQVYIVQNEDDLHSHTSKKKSTRRDILGQTRGYTKGLKATLDSRVESKEDKEVFPDCKMKANELEETSPLVECSKEDDVSFDLDQTPSSSPTDKDVTDHKDENYAVQELNGISRQEHQETAQSQLAPTYAEEDLGTEMQKLKLGVQNNPADVEQCESFLSSNSDIPVETLNAIACHVPLYLAGKFAMQFGMDLLQWEQMIGLEELGSPQLRAFHDNLKNSPNAAAIHDNEPAGKSGMLLLEKTEVNNQWWSKALEILQEEINGKHIENQILKEEIVPACSEQNRAYYIKHMTYTLLDIISHRNVNAKQCIAAAAKASLPTYYSQQIDNILNRKPHKGSKLSYNDLPCSKSTSTERDNDTLQSKATRGETARVEATRVEATRVEATRVEATRVEATRVEATRVEATRVEATRVEAEKTGITNKYFFNVYGSAPMEKLTRLKEYLCDTEDVQHRDYSEFKNGQNSYSDFEKYFKSVNIDTRPRIGIAVIDSGCESLLQSKRDITLGSCKNYINTVEDELEDRNGHGTLVTEIIHRYCGIAHVSFYHYIVLEENSLGRSRDITRALQEIKQRCDIHIVNMSLQASHYTSEMKNLLDEIGRTKVLISAAGNDVYGRMECVYPAMNAMVMAVSGNGLTISADITKPFVHVYCNAYSADYEEKPATSFAAAHASGLAAVALRTADSMDKEHARRLQETSYLDDNLLLRIAYGLPWNEEAIKCMKTIQCLRNYNADKELTEREIHFKNFCDYVQIKRLDFYTLRTMIISICPDIDKRRLDTMKTTTEMCWYIAEIDDKRDIKIALRSKLRECTRIEHSSYKDDLMCWTENDEKKNHVPLDLKMLRLLFLYKQEQSGATPDALLKSLKKELVHHTHFHDYLDCIVKGPSRMKLLTCTEHMQILLMKLQKNQIGNATEQSEQFDLELCQKEIENIVRNNYYPSEIPTFGPKCETTSSSYSDCKYATDAYSFVKQLEHNSSNKKAAIKCQLITITCYYVFACLCLLFMLC